MSIARRLWAGLRLAVLAGVCGVVLAFAVAGSVLFAYRWGEATASHSAGVVRPTAMSPSPPTTWRF